MPPSSHDSNTKALKLMDAKVLCRYELPLLEQWSPALHWRAGLALAIVVGVLCCLLMAAGDSSLATSMAVGGIGAGTILGVTNFIARKNAERLAYLRALNEGIRQLEALATD